jgi:lipid A 3-O-deacylase
MSPRILFIIILVVLCSFVCADPSPAADHDFILGIQFENDFFGGGTDRHFTHGTRLELLTRPIGWITEGANKLPWFSYKQGKDDTDDPLEGRASISLGQNIYTPRDTFSSKILPKDRLYAGWLYLGFGLVATQGNERGDKRYDKVHLEVGLVGPESYAEDVQTFWHSMLGLHVPEGWDNQLNNELGVVLYYEQARRLKQSKSLCGLDFDIIPHFGGSVGNVLTHGAAGLVFRLGPTLRDDFGPPRIRPSLAGSVYFPSKEDINWYVFGGLQGRVIFRNIFLDGNTLTDSPSVDKRYLVGDIQGGIVLQWNRIQVSYTQIYRTREHKYQESADIFGSFNISCQF